MGRRSHPHPPAGGRGRHNPVLQWSWPSPSQWLVQGGRRQYAEGRMHTSICTINNHPCSDFKVVPHSILQHFGASDKAIQPFSAPKLVNVNYKNLITSQFKGQMSVVGSLVPRPYPPTRKRSLVTNEPFP